MAPLSTFALSGLLALSTFSSATPIPPRVASQGQREVGKAKRALPSLSLKHRVTTSAPPAGAVFVADVDRARYASHLNRVGRNTQALAVAQQLHGWWPFGDGFGGGFGGFGGHHGGDGEGSSGGVGSPSGSSGSGGSTGSSSGSGGSTGTSGSSSNTSDPGAGTDVKVINSVVSYLAEVQVGNPPTTYNLVIDTGSSNTWVGADPANPYKKTSTSQATNQAVSVTYGSGQFNGSEFLDTVALSGGLSTTQSIGAASSAVGFDGVDGILGVGPIDLTTNTLSGGQKQTIPTIMDNLLKDGTIETEVLGVSFVPTVVAQDSANGVLSFGGVDENAFVGDVVFQPITKTAPASSFWGANISLTLDNSPLSDSMAGILDTGTTLFLVADDIFTSYAKAIPGAKLDNQQTGLLQIPIANLAKMPTLNIEFAGQNFPLSADAQVFPRALNTALGGSQNFAYSIVSSLGTPSGQGLDYILGMTVLERFYSVYDTTNNQVGMALTAQTNASFFNATASTAPTTGNNDITTPTSGAVGLSLRFGSSAAAAIAVVALLM